MYILCIFIIDDVLVIRVAIVSEKYCFASFRSMFSYPIVLPLPWWPWCFFICTNVYGVKHIHDWVPRKRHDASRSLLEIFIDDHHHCCKKNASSKEWKCIKTSKIPVNKIPWNRMNIDIVVSWTIEMHFSGGWWKSINPNKFGVTGNPAIIQASYWPRRQRELLLLRSVSLFWDTESGPYVITYLGVRPIS